MRVSSDAYALMQRAQVATANHERNCKNSKPKGFQYHEESTALIQTSEAAGDDSSELDIATIDRNEQANADVLDTTKVAPDLAQDSKDLGEGHTQGSVIRNTLPSPA